MARALPANPRFVDRILDWPPLWFLARLALVSAYLVGAGVKLFNWPAAVAEQAHFGLKPPEFMAALTIAVELIGAILVMSKRFVWLGAGMLGVFTALAALVANSFWTLPPGPDRFTAANAFFEHLGLIGGFVLAAGAARKHQEALS